MKSSTLLVCALLCVTSCELFEDDISFGRPHEYSRRYGSRTECDSTGNIPGKRVDTVLYISAVRMPARYDWQRDTAYGAVDAELVLYRNFKEILSIPAGPHVSADADRHFIHDGHLYTERQNSSETFIGRDGQDLMRIQGREELKGILVQDSNLFTITSPIGKDGFTLRSGGEILMMKNSGRVYGGMLMPSYRPGGALYMNGGRVSFCYSSDGTPYKVEDGMETVFRGTPNDIQDMRVIGSKDISAGTDFMGLGLGDLSIWPLAEGFAVSGLATGSGYPAIYRSSGGSVQTIPLTEARAVYVSNGYAFAVACSREGKVTVADTQESRELDGTWYFFSPACAAPGPAGPALALTPREKGKRPAVIYGGRTITMDINGFLTGIMIELEEED